MCGVCVRECAQNITEIAAICDNMNGLQGHCITLNKAEKDKYCMVSLKCGIRKKCAEKQFSGTEGTKDGEADKKGTLFQL